MIIEIKNHDNDEEQKSDDVIYAPLVDNESEDSSSSIEDELAGLEQDIDDNQKENKQNENNVKPNEAVMQGAPAVHREPKTYEDWNEEANVQQDEYKDATEADIQQPSTLEELDGIVEQDDSVPREEYQLLEERLSRLMSDWDNYRKRTTEDIRVAKANANKNLVEALIPTLDNFKLAILHIDTQNLDPATKGTIDGFIAIYKSLMSSLEREGLEIIEPQIGSAFDMAEHQAVARAEGTDMSPDCVAAVVQVGYKFNGSVIRPAMVSVSV